MFGNVRYKNKEQNLAEEVTPKHAGSENKILSLTDISSEVNKRNINILIIIKSVQ